MEVKKIDYKMKKFNEENVRLMLESFGLDVNNYIMTNPQPSLLELISKKYTVSILNKWCVICFSRKELNLIMLSISGKKAVKKIKIDRSEIEEIRLLDVSILYNVLKMKADGLNMKFQIFKIIPKFRNIKSALSEFRKLYNL